jgi:hypothetical protein
MRRLIIVLSAASLAVPLASVPASAAPMKSCGPVKMAGYPKQLAIKVKVKNLSCADAKLLWTSYVATGEAVSPAIDALKATCKDDSKAARKKAAKVNRLAIVCRQGKVVTTAWALGG